MNSFFILLIFIATLGVGYGMHLILGRLFNPRKSGFHLFLYFLTHFASILLLAYLAGLAILIFGLRELKQ